MHLDNYQGLGPGLPLNALGLPATDPLALMPVLARSDVANQLPGFVPGQRLGPLPGPAPGPLAAPPTQQPQQWLPPWMQPPPTRTPECAVFCIKDQPAPYSPHRCAACGTADGPAGAGSSPRAAGTVRPAPGPAPAAPIPGPLAPPPGPAQAPVGRHPARASTVAGSTARTGWLVRASSRPRLDRDVLTLPLTWSPRSVPG